MAAVLGFTIAWATPGVRAEDVQAINANAPWRVYLVMGGPVNRVQGKLQYNPRYDKTVVFDPAKIDTATFRTSPLPSAEWTNTDFNDVCWPRYQGDLADFLGDYGTEVPNGTSLWPARICMRTGFGIADPEKVTDLKLTVEYLGGAVVYVNGQEVGRGNMPDGEIRPFTCADDYPSEAYVSNDGVTPLPTLAMDKRSTPTPDNALQPRYQKRIRTVTIDVPSRVLVKGRNVLAIALHRAAIAGPFARSAWSHVGFRDAALTSASGSGVVAYADAVKGTHLWSASTVDEVCEIPAPKSLIKRSWFWAMCWGRGMPVKGVQQGNPFDPVLPIKVTMPRNGVGSGQTVLSDPDGLKDITATLDPLKGPDGAVIAPDAVQIRFAAQPSTLHYCDTLMPAAPQGAKTVPVWLVVQASKDQAVGWYTSTLRLTANGKPFTVPVQVLVTGLILPDAKDFSSTVGMTQSPDTVATQYGVPLWSDAHFKLLESSFALLGQVGNDTVHVPVLVSGVGAAGGKSSFSFSWSPLIRWIKTDKGLTPDFTVLEKYLDTYSKYCAPPRGISLYIWGQSSSREVADAYENRRIPSRENVKFAPPRIVVWDPKTDTTTTQNAPFIGDEGSEAFWKPLFDGVHALVVKRGWSERAIMLGLGGDIRPGQKTVDLLKQWAPYARWDYLSHFSGDPGPKDGKMIATGGAEIGMMEHPGGGMGLPAFEQSVSTPRDFLLLPTDRWVHMETSPPLIFRTMKADVGCIGRLGLDFWNARRGGTISTSFFSHVNSLTVPGADGAMPTVRFQMFREDVQDMEVRTQIIRAYLRLPDTERAPYRAVLGELSQRYGLGSPFYLSQNELAYDWPGYVARLHQTAAQLAGVKVEAKWDVPPTP
ncbi:MAG: glycoside hydrolase domain-containing protein [Verrucomicrobiota bacterium]